MARAESGIQRSVTELLRCTQNGDSGAADALARLVYAELRELAGGQLRRERSAVTLQPTALVNEAWMRLAGSRASFENRAHFFGSAARAMRRILIERARAARAERRGGGAARASISQVEIPGESRPVDLLDLDLALEQLERIDPHKAAVVSLRFLLGCTVEETATALGISPAKVKKDWAFARAWLRTQLDDQPLG